MRNTFISIWIPIFIVQNLFHTVFGLLNGPISLHNSFLNSLELVQNNILQISNCIINKSKIIIKISNIFGNPLYLISIILDMYRLLRNPLIKWFEHWGVVGAVGNLFLQMIVRLLQLLLQLVDQGGGRGGGRVSLHFHLFNLHTQLRYLLLKLVVLVSLLGRKLRANLV